MTGTHPQSGLARTRARLALRTRVDAFLHPLPTRVGTPAESSTPPSRPRARPKPHVRLPARRGEPGGLTLAKGDGFFDRHPRFLDTSTTGNARWRLNLRHEALITENRDILEGARVLDIASHDGRWTHAALCAGAAHVVGAEARPELVASAEENLTAYGADPDRYRFVTGDIFQTLAQDPPQVDVVLCLGFLYHTLRYGELFSIIERCNPRYLIVDTRVERRAGPFVRLRAEGIVKPGSAFSAELSPGGRVVVGRPSIRAVRKLARTYDFQLDRFSDWAGLLEDNPGARVVEVYRRRQRASMRFERTHRPGAGGSGAAD